MVGPETAADPPATCVAQADTISADADASRKFLRDNGSGRIGTGHAPLERDFAESSRDGRSIKVSRP
jgi:hypothetical protein